MAKIWVGLTEGVRSDTYSEVVPVADSENCEGLPDGTGVEGRRGCSILKRYDPILPNNRQVSDPNRIALQVDYQPPQKTDGTYLFSAIDKSNQNTVLVLADFKPRSNLPNDNLESDVQFDENEYSVLAGETLPVTVMRTGALDREQTVDYATANGTATAGVDYTAASGTLTFSEGDASKTISIVTADTNQLTNETLSLTLSNPTSGAIIVGQNPVTVYIMSPEIQPVLFRSSGAADYQSVFIFGKENTTDAQENRGTAITLPSSTPTARQIGSRSGADRLVNIDLDTSDFLLLFDCYGMNALLAQGSYYTGPQTSTPYKTIIEPVVYTDFEPTIADRTLWTAVPYNNETLILASGTRGYYLNSRSGSLRRFGSENARTWALDAGWWLSGISMDIFSMGGLSGISRMPVVVDSSGFLVSIAAPSDAAATYGAKLVRINPLTGAVVGEIDLTASPTSFTAGHMEIALSATNDNRIILVCYARGGSSTDIEYFRTNSTFTAITSLGDDTTTGATYHPHASTGTLACNQTEIVILPLWQSATTARLQIVDCSGATHSNGAAYDLTSSIAGNTPSAWWVNETSMYAYVGNPSSGASAEARYYRLTNGSGITANFAMDDPATSSPLSVGQDIFNNPDITQYARRHIQGRIFGV